MAYYGTLYIYIYIDDINDEEFALRTIDHIHWTRSHFPPKEHPPQRWPRKSE